MAFTAGYPNFVPTPIAPRGLGQWGYDTGYQYAFNCRSANNFSFICIEYVLVISGPIRPTHYLPFYEICIITAN